MYTVRITRANTDTNSRYLASYFASRPQGEESMQTNPRELFTFEIRAHKSAPEARAH